MHGLGPLIRDYVRSVGLLRKKGRRRLPPERVHSGAQAPDGRVGRLGCVGEPCRSARGRNPVLKGLRDTAGKPGRPFRVSKTH